ncbi:MAG TPA: DUF4105 domain-containing protein [Steroidobacter sp.]
MRLPRTRLVLRWLAHATGHLIQALLLIWGTLAIWFWPGLPVGVRLAVAIAFAALGIWALWLTRSRKVWLGFAGLYLVLLIGWTAIAPQLDRQWRPEVAVLPRAYISGDRVRLVGVRDFDYRSTNDFTPRYLEREVQLSRLTGVDFYISYWMPGPIGHTFLSFIFDDAEPISISIEARPEAHEGFAPVGSLFKQFELIYVVGEERDVVGVRTNHRAEDVYLYRISTTPENARRLFLIYLERINELSERPEFYHLLSNNCTLNIVRYANAIGPGSRFDIRHYLNGLFDGYLYQRQLLEGSLPFEELRRRAHINEAAQAAGEGTDFSQRIRAQLGKRS